MPADTTTPVFGFVKQGVGNNNTTWGDILDANMVKVENAVAGCAIVTVSGDTSLTSTEMSKPVVVLTGTLAADTEVNFENIGGPRTWVIVNTCVMSTYTLTLEFDRGPNFDIDLNAIELVYFDGDESVHHNSGF